eukprot:TRINITY_DN1078_c0_g1_i1.p1 TRINITY_DN1078_c0_g1~~TRINITY_DN1078_c0_g1_i1.p1  ORF type:complete len:965 (+),score=111.58 TRINITY_DN1078_c0_g1_i1:28-2895(+)
MKTSQSVLTVVIMTFLCLFSQCIRSSPPLNVHIIAHTHDDVGWLKTVDEYYVGAREHIQHAGVQYILDNVMYALNQNPDRKFIYVETAFFYRWWNQQDNDMKNLVKKFVANGQLEFINGGWSMNDEATTHYQVITENMAMGARYLQSIFGIVPKVGWHIDPFGHQQTQAALMYQFGFDGFFFARIDFEDYQQRKESRNLQTIWRPSPSAGPQNQVFVGAFWDGTYCYPRGFNFEGGDSPVQDDPAIFGYNVSLRAQEFVDDIRNRAQYYRTNDILVTFGCDFQYMNADLNFKNMDKLMRYINQNKHLYNINIFYSTPSIYLDAVNSADVSWPVKTDDFLPYADGPHAYWTGFYTSRPALKGYVRSRVSFIHAVESLLSTGLSPSQLNQNMKQKLLSLRDALNIANHHDAITGTERQAVADDYALRLSIGTDKTYEVLREVLPILISNGNNDIPFKFCPEQNISLCPATEQLSSLGENQILPVVVYNSQALSITTVATIPVPVSDVVVFDSEGHLIVSEVHTIGNKNTIYFEVSVPAVGYKTFFLSRGKGTLRNPYSVQKEGNFSIQNNFMRLNFSSNDLSSYESFKNNISHSLSHNYMWYDPMTVPQASGAYIFRPKGEAISFNGDKIVEISSGDLVSIVSVIEKSWLKKVYRLYKNQNYIEVEQHVGPIDISNGDGKEIIVRYNTDIENGKTFFTDSQGQEMIKRVLNHRDSYKLNLQEHISGNYYPISQSAFIRDQKRQFTLITDRARGVTSLNRGELETMVHRRLLVDDGRGVGEPLNDTSKIVTIDRLFSSDLKTSTIEMRTAMQDTLNPIQYYYSSPDTLNNWYNYKTSFSGLNRDLPKNVYMQTIRPVLFPIDSNEYILRLHHIYAIDEDPILSKPVIINLKDIFSKRIILSIKEMNLLGTTNIKNIHHKKWKTINKPSKKSDRIDLFLKENEIIIYPMETKTYIITLQ